MIKWAILLRRPFRAFNNLLPTQGSAALRPGLCCHAPSGLSNPRSCFTRNSALRVSLLICSLLFPTINFVYASSNQETLERLFAQGNSEYQKGSYALAEKYYTQILNSGVDSGSVYYNLGNACFKEKKLGEAIYYWEKAQQKLPADRDLRENLALADLMIVDRIETRADPLPVRVLSALPGLFTIRQETRVVFVLFVIANLLFSLSLLSKNSRNSLRALIASMVIAFLFVVFGCSLGWKLYERDYRKNGIVIEQKADVRSGPGPENITVFTVHEGIKVRVHELTNGWYQISLPNGWNGWLQQNYLWIL